MTQPSCNRRGLLRWIGASASLAVLGACGSGRAEAKSFPVRLTEAQWRKKLSKQEFYILRQAGTERAYSSPLNDESRQGTFICAGCGNARRSNFPPRFRNTDVSKQFSRVRLSPSNESKTFAKSMSENWRYIAGNLARSTTLAYRSMSSTGKCTLPRLMAYSDNRDFPPLPKWTRPSG